jgi:hypothetical protein
MVLTGRMAAGLADGVNLALELGWAGPGRGGWQLLRRGARRKNLAAALKLER